MDPSFPQSKITDVTIWSHEKRISFCLDCPFDSRKTVSVSATREDINKVS